MNKNAIIRNVLVVGGIVVFGMSVYGIYEYYKVQLELLYKFSYNCHLMLYILYCIAVINVVSKCGHKWVYKPHLFSHSCRIC